MSESNINEEKIPRFFDLYNKTIKARLMEKFQYKNIMSVPCIEKIVINMGIGAATGDIKIVDKAAQELGLIAGQKPKICRAKKAISNFKLRENIPIGCCVTLRRKRMYEFLDRLISIATPRIRDFRGLSSNSFDGKGNYNFGLTEQNIFPEVNIDKVNRTQGMNISIHTTAKTDAEAKELLKSFGFPFRR